MGTFAQKILKMEVKIVVGLLNQALADEWLAVYQYWAGSKTISGPMRIAVATELENHMKEELHHANILADRIIQLGGTPVLNPAELFNLSPGGYSEPTDTATAAILKQNISGEQHAIQFYSALLEQVRGKDPVTHNTVLEILKDELEHEHDLESFLKDMHP